ncbi:MAG: histidine kinase [Muribaculaceae bacterium]|nr:histidine kinase [Muribaculaceae bacterium]
MNTTSITQNAKLITGKKVQLWIDLFFCLVLLPVMIYLLPIERWLENNFLFVCLLVAWLYIVYFVNRVFTIPSLFKNRKRLIWAVLIVIAMIGITYLLSKYKMEFHFQRQPGQPPAGAPQQRTFSPMKFRLHQQAVWFLFVIVMTFSSAIGLLGQLYRLRARRQELEAAKNKAELSLYKAQIDPHFLFNTLNTLYSMVVTQSPKTEDAFIQFIDITRYIYNNANQDSVSIDSEAHYLQQYIDLQRNRLNECTKVNFNYNNDGKYPGLTIAPMLLITFVENALKYGVSTSIDTNIDIDVQVVDGVFTLTTSNPIRIKPKDDSHVGIGIENSRKRLDLIYGSDYSLDINETEDQFDLKLTIDLKHHKP